MDPVSSQKSEDPIYTAPEPEFLQLAMMKCYIGGGHDIHRHYCGIFTVHELPFVPEICVHIITNIGYG